MLTSQKRLLILGSPDFNKFLTRSGEIPSSQLELARKLKDLVLLSSMIFEKNSIDHKFNVAFSGLQQEDGFSINYFQGNQDQQFTGLKFSHGSIISCNFDIKRQNLDQLFDGKPGISISGIICPAIDDYSLGILRNQKIECFVMANKILSNKRENLGTILGLNKDLVPKLKLIQGDNFVSLAMEEVRKFL